MIKQYIGERLYRQMALIILLALVASGALYFLSAYIIEKAICDHYANHPALVQKNAEAKIDALQAYVLQHDVAASDRAALTAWVGKNPLLIVQIHQNNRLVFDSTRQSGAALHTHMNEHSPSTTQLVQTVAFTDGEAQVSIAVFPEHALVDTLTKVLLVFCAVLFLCITLFGVRRKIRYIVQLEQEVLSIAGGDLSLPITRLGGDELANLADCIDEMRHSLTQRIQQEGSRQQERHDWITALSHDIRTPLTALIGYMEVMQKSALPEAERGYIAKSAQKAFQLKQITDMMFSCLSADAPLMEAGEMITAEAFVEGYVAGCVEMIREAGFQTTLEREESPCGEVAIHPAAAHRVFSNMCTNIARYASRDFPVTVRVFGGCETLNIQVHSVTSRQAALHGTGLGLGICENMMRNMGGDFSAQPQGGCFEYRLAFHCPARTPILSSASQSPSR